MTEQSAEQIEYLEAVLLFHEPNTPPSTCAACDYTDNGWCTCSCHQLAYTPSGLDEFHGPTSLWVDPSPPVLALFEEDK
jgi:hypothetical protein